MTSVIRNIQAVVGTKIKLLYLPILLAILDAFLKYDFLFRHDYEYRYLDPK